MIYNIDPKLWGKYFWGTIHYVTISYPLNPTEKNKKVVKDFLESLEFLLPCENCRHHYSENLKKNPLTDDILNTKYKLVEWAVNLHNEVNLRTGKKHVSVPDALDIYSKPRFDEEKMEQHNYNTVMTIILLIFLMIVLVYYVKFKN